MTNNCFLFCFDVLFRDDSDEASDSHLQVVKRKIVKKKRNRGVARPLSASLFFEALGHLH